MNIPFILFLHFQRLRGSEEYLSTIHLLLSIASSRLGAVMIGFMRGQCGNREVMNQVEEGGRGRG